MELEVFLSCDILDIIYGKSVGFRRQPLREYYHLGGNTIEKQRVKPSVSIAMKNLREKNHITVTDAGFIYLTDEGKQIAEMIYERHNLLSECLIKLGVAPETATEDACRIEHVISRESFAALKKYIADNHLL